MNVLGRYVARRLKIEVLLARHLNQLIQRWIVELLPPLLQFLLGLQCVLRRFFYRPITWQGALLWVDVIRTQSCTRTQSENREYGEAWFS